MKAWSKNPPISMDVIETALPEFTATREEIEVAACQYRYCISRVLSDKKKDWERLLMAKELLAAQEAKANLNKLVKGKQLNFLALTSFGSLMIRAVSHLIHVEDFVETKSAMLESPDFAEIFGDAMRVPNFVPGADGNDPYFRSAIRAISEAKGFKHRAVGSLAMSIWFSMFEQAFFDETDRAGHHSGVPIGPALLGPESCGTFRSVGATVDDVGFCARTCCANSFIGAHPSETARFWLLLELYFPSLEPDFAVLRRPRFYVDCYNAVIAALTVARRAVVTLPVVAPPAPSVTPVPSVVGGKRKRRAEPEPAVEISQKRAKPLVASS